MLQVEVMGQLPLLKRVLASGVSKLWKSAFKYHSPRYWHMVDLVEANPPKEFVEPLLKNHASGIRELRCHANMDDTTLLLMLERATRLVTLDLSHCKQISLVGMMMLREAIPTGIQSLTLDVSASSVNDQILKGIAQRCPRLTHLNASCAAHKVSDESITELAQNCQNLKGIELESQSVTDASLRAIAATCSNVERINLAYCEADFGLPGISDEGPA